MPGRKVISLRYVMAAAALIACCTALYETSSDARADRRAGEKYISSGYRTVADKDKTAVMNADTTAVMEEEMDTSYITATVEEKTISGVMSGDLKLNMEKISALPRMLGNVDLIKTIQLTPGITTYCSMGHRSTMPRTLWDSSPYSTATTYHHQPSTNQTFHPNSEDACQEYSNIAK